MLVKLKMYSNNSVLRLPKCRQYLYLETKSANQSAFHGHFLELLRCLFLHSVSLSQDGHVEVARLLLDSGAQVNMPADSFESPLTLAACGGHVELAALLIERGANLEEVGDDMDSQMPEQVCLFISENLFVTAVMNTLETFDS